MAEAAPTQTQEAPTEEMPTAGESRIPVTDLTVNADFDPAMDQRDRTMHLVRKIEGDAKLRGFEDLGGLELAVKDDQGQSKRFVVIDGTTRVVNEPVTMARGMVPHFAGPIRIKNVKDEPHKRSRLGLETGLKWNTKTVTHKKVGMPHIVKRVGKRRLERREEPIDPVRRKFVTFQTFDEEGTPLGIETKQLSDFYAIASSALMSEGRDGGEDGAGPEHPQAQWSWKGRKTENETDPNGEHDLAIGLQRKGKAAFTDITEQLERRGITNWTGLTWKLANPGNDPGGEPSDSTKKGIPVRERTQTIIYDGGVEEDTYSANNTDTRYARKFLLRTVEHYADGSEVVVGKDKTLADFELWQYLEKHLEKARDFNEKSKDPEALHESLKATSEHPVIWDMRMPGADQKTTPQFEMPETAERVWGLPERVSLDEALGMLSYPELYPRNEQGNADFEEHIAKLKEGKEKEYGEEVQKIIAEAGIGHFHAIVQKLHGEIYDMYASSAKHLDLPDTPAEELSASWIVEGLAKRSREGRLNGSGDPFGDVLAMPHLVRDLADEHIGEMFGRASIRVSTVTVPDGVNEKDGTQKVKEKVVHRFNEDLFEIVPRIEGLGTTKKWRDKIWKPIEKLTREVYDANPSPDDEKAKPAREITYKDYQALGRMLRRTVGE